MKNTTNKETVCTTDIAELVHNAIVAEGGKLGKKAIYEVIQRTFDEIIKLIIDGKDIRVRGFGRIHVKQLKERKTYNFITKKIYTVAPKRIAYVPSQTIRKAIKD